MSAPSRRGAVAVAPEPRGSVPMESSTLLAFRRRDAGAVRAMYREYGNLVYAVAHRYLGRHDLAEDAVQQTFVRAWQSADRIDVDRDPAPWLATIAKHAAIDIYRREARRPTTPLTESMTRGPMDPHVTPETLDTVWHVRRAIETLPIDEATIVRLQHLDGMTQNEISEKLGVALGTVKSRSHRAHRKLAGMLGHLRERSHD
jgi:RNA polymerase sigma-70 factor (ECF subfamily)